MARTLKATLGIRFQEKMFRLSSLTGALTDDLLALRGHGVDTSDFDTVGRDVHDNGLDLYSEATGRYLHVDVQHVVYTHDLYVYDGMFHFDDFLERFRKIWTTIDKRLNCGEIRRLGFVTEHRHSIKDASSFLLKKLTTFSESGFPAKFVLSFEERRNTGVGGLPDPAKDDFLNIISNYYDGIMDSQHPEADSVNANLDVQRYYAPALHGNVVEEIRKLKKEYDRCFAQFSNRLKELGLTDGEAA